jgi:hypothetical protein
MKEQVRQRIESLERELQGLKDELQPEIEVGSWWVGNLSGEKAKVAKVSNKLVLCTHDTGVEIRWNSSEFTELFTPCEAPEAPAKETWYLCTEDCAGFTRGKEYLLDNKVTHSLAVFNLIDNQNTSHGIVDGGHLKNFTAPQER